MAEDGKPYSLNKLSGFVGDDPQQILEMVDLFIQTIPPELTLLKNNASNNLYGEVATVAHRIKPSIDVFDIRDALQIIRTLELFCRNGQNLHQVSALVDELVEKISLALDVMRGELD